MAVDAVLFLMNLLLKLCLVLVLLLFLLLLDVSQLLGLSLYLLLLSRNLLMFLTKVATHGVVPAVPAERPSQGQPLYET